MEVRTIPKIIALKLTNAIVMDLDFGESIAESMTNDGLLLLKYFIKIKVNNYQNCLKVGEYKSVFPY